VESLCDTANGHFAVLRNFLLVRVVVWILAKDHRFKFHKRCQLFIRAHDAVIRVYDAAGNVIETHEHAGEFKEW
jgi:hypothetical protein